MSPRASTSAGAAPPDHDAPDGAPRQGDVTSTTRVTVAFPFSRITANEPSELLGALVRVVDRLATVVERVAADDEAAEVARQAREHVARLPDAA